MYAAREGHLDMLQLLLHSGMSAAERVMHCVLLLPSLRP